jgi:EmrB/QacA subfamily drug resistance transporter
VTVEPLTWGSRAGRLTLAATIVASGAAFLDGTVVNVALPHIGADLGGGFATLQWVVDGYLLTLGSLVLVGGSLGDLLGRRRVYLWGIAGFGIASAACAVSPTSATLIAARIVQGVAAALLVPSSLAILSSAFTGADRGRAIGAWSGLSGVFTALGPFVGGTLVDAFPWGWRLVFAINLPLVTLAWWLTKLGVPELPGRPSDLPLHVRLDLRGATLAVVGLTLLVHPLIEAGQLPHWLIATELVTAVVALAGFLRLEAREPAPMLELGLFKLRSFSVANLVTFVVYGALGTATFLLSLQLQDRLGYSALEAGASLLPLTLIMVLFSARIGMLLPRIGARPLLTAGPLIVAVGLLGLSQIAEGTRFWTGVLPWVVVFSGGMLLVVAPVTTTALADVPQDSAGVASGVNNSVARIAGLVSVAVLPLVGRLGGAAAGSSRAYAHAVVAAAVLCALGGIIAMVGLPPLKPHQLQRQPHHPVPR